MNIKPEGPCCPVSSPLQDMRIPWVAADQTDVAKTFAREIARMRSPFNADAYSETDRDHHMAFIGGFKT